MTKIHSKNELMHEILSTSIRNGKWLSFHGTKMVVQLFPMLEKIPGLRYYGREAPKYRQIARKDAVKARRRLLNKVRCRTPKKLWAA